MRGTLTEARQKLDVVTEAAGRLAERLGLPTPTDRAGLDVLLRSARRVLGGVRFEGADVKSPEWRTRQADVRELIEAGEKLEHLHSEYDAMLLPEAWTQDRDLLEARAIEQCGAKLAAVLLGRVSPGKADGGDTL